MEQQHNKISIRGSQGDPSDELCSPVDPCNILTPYAADEIMLRHVRVNAIADDYDISELKRLANAKIQHIFEITTWPANCYMPGRSSDVMVTQNYAA